MPWESYAAQDAAVREFKDAVARGENRIGIHLKDSTVDGHLACAIGWAAKALHIQQEKDTETNSWRSSRMARAMGLTSDEAESIWFHNDKRDPEAAIAAMLAVPVGGATE